MNRPRSAFHQAALAACLAMLRIGSPANAEEPVVSAALADSAAGLAATSAVPWNPPRAIPTHEPWEQVLNAPLTLVSLPIRALGALTQATLLRVQEDHLIPRAHHKLAVVTRSGFGVAPTGLGDRSGFGGGASYAPPPLHGWLRASLAGSFQHYHRGQVELGPRWLFGGYSYDWRPRETFYGVGSDADAGDVSNYAMQAERIELRLRRRVGTQVRREVDAWWGERESVLRSGRDADRPSVETVFPQSVAGALDLTQHHVLTGAHLALDARAGRPHWARGWRLDAQAERIGAMRGHGLLFAGDTDSPGFRRVTLAGQVGWSFMHDPRTLRLAARVVDVQPLDRTRPPALFDLSRLGGAAGLAGFEPGRFHDLDLCVVSFAYLFPLVEYGELELSTELGAVSGDVWHATRIDGLEHSYSLLLRPRSHAAPLGAIGVSWSREGARMRVVFGGVE